jgi:hypothetical protein
VNVSAVNPMPSIKRTSLNVYGADIFNCSRHTSRCERPRAMGGCSGTPIRARKISATG